VLCAFHDSNVLQVVVVMLQVDNVLSLSFSTLTSLVSPVSPEPEWFLSTSLLSTLLHVVQRIAGPPGAVPLPLHSIISAFHILGDILRQKLGSAPANAAVVEVILALSQVLQVQVSSEVHSLIAIILIFYIAIAAEHHRPKWRDQVGFGSPTLFGRVLSSRVRQPIFTNHSRGVTIPFV
jgi:hypothetical protein